MNTPNQPHVYFIGGAPRVGKSLLAMHILRQRPMFVVSADAVRDMLQGVLKPLDAPALFAIHNLAKHESAMANFLKKHPNDGVKLQNDESAVVWPWVLKLIESYVADGKDVLVEGVEILPSNLAILPYAYKAVFLGNTSAEHANTIAQQAHAQPHDWMHRYTSGTVDAWAGLVRSFSGYIKADAGTHNMPYLEMHDTNFEQSLHEAEQILLA
jgi:2-phosphoglycerate kinase